jgi:BASS family bile acid:Na+ symporter
VLWLVAGLHADYSLTKPALLLAMLVVLPTITGYWMSRRSPRLRLGAERYSSIAASIALLWIIATVVAGNRDRLVSVGAVLAGGLLVINAAGYAAGYAVGRLAGLPDRFRRALTLEVGMQNAGLGTALAASLYGATTAALIPTAAYTFGCMFTGTVLAAAWQRRCQRAPAAV